MRDKNSEGYTDKTAADAVRNAEDAIYQEKKKYLFSYKDMGEEIQRLTEELEELRLNKICPSIVQDGMPRGSNQNDLSKYAAKVDEIERKIMKERYERIKRFEEIRNSIETLDNQEERNVLKLKKEKLLKTMRKFLI